MLLEHATMPVVKPAWQGDTWAWGVTSQVGLAVLIKIPRRMISVIFVLNTIV